MAIGVRKVDGNQAELRSSRANASHLASSMKQAKNEDKGAGMVRPHTQILAHKQIPRGGQSGRMTDIKLQRSV